MNLFSLTPVGILNDKARDYISHVFPNVLNKIQYEVKDYIPLEVREIADGCYEEGIVYLHSKSELKTAIHEIAHAIHYQLFNAEKIEFSSNNNYLNYKEEFAEIFTEAVFKIKDSISLEKEERECYMIINSYLNEESAA
jgi:hypothetical protein